MGVTHDRQGIIDLLEYTGLDAREVVVTLMDRIESDKKESLHKIKELTEKLSRAEETIDKVDELVLDAGIKVPCRVCDSLYHLDYEVSAYDPRMSYCGRSENCCP